MKLQIKSKFAVHPCIILSDSTESFDILITDKGFNILYNTKKLYNVK